MRFVNTALAILFAVLLWPNQVGHLVYLQLNQAIAISADRNQPPYIAHEEVERSLSENDWDEMDRATGVDLYPGQKQEISQPISLAGLTLKSQVGQKQQDEFVIPKNEGESPVVASAATVSAGAETNRLQKTAAFEMSGSFSLSDGLHYTNNETFEVWRRAEGIYTDQGVIEPLKGTYRIESPQDSGEIVIRMRDSGGIILAEQAFPIHGQKRNSPKIIVGPDVRLQPQIDVAASFYDLYRPQKAMRATDLSAFILNDEGPLQQTDPSVWTFAKIAPGSWSFLRAEKEGFMRTLSAIPSGQNQLLAMMPNEMATALKQIVSDSLRLNLNDPDGAIVWGSALFENKPIAGVTVSVEEDSGAVVIYFNELMLPDPTLQATSSNGQYAILGLSNGYHAILAQRGNGYFSHGNAAIESGTTTLLNLESTLRTAPVPVRVFDAFTGQPISATVTHQGVEETFEIDQRGEGGIQIPLIKRLSYIDSNPVSGYLPAVYQIDDSRGYVHLPQIRPDWLAGLIAAAKLDDIPQSSIVVGFVPDEDFQVEPPSGNQRVQVVYFDAQGGLSREGTAGGGFIIRGLSAGPQDLALFGKKSNQLLVRIVSPDPYRINIMTIRAE